MNFAASLERAQKSTIEVSLHLEQAEKHLDFDVLEVYKASAKELSSGLQHSSSLTKGLMWSHRESQTR